MKLLDEIVKRMLEEHVGGEVFFDNLDMEVQREPIVNQLLERIEEMHQNANFIVSGKFGLFFHNYLRTLNKYSDKNIIVVEGGLRKTNKLDLLYMKESIKNKNFIFLDDSFYLGRTRDTIKREIERLGGNFLHTYVIYDGSMNKEDEVSSLYRYYY